MARTNLKVKGTRVTHRDIAKTMVFPLLEVKSEYETSNPDRVAIPRSVTNAWSYYLDGDGGVCAELGANSNFGEPMSMANRDTTPDTIESKVEEYIGEIGHLKANQKLVLRLAYVHSARVPFEYRQDVQQELIAYGLENLETFVGKSENLEAYIYGSFQKKIGEWHENFYRHNEYEPFVFSEIHLDLDDTNPLNYDWDKYLDSLNTLKLGDWSKVSCLSPKPRGTKAEAIELKAKYEATLEKRLARKEANEFRSWVASQIEYVFATETSEAVEAESDAHKLWLELPKRMRDCLKQLWGCGYEEAIEEAGELPRSSKKLSKADERWLERYRERVRSSEADGKLAVALRS